MWDVLYAVRISRRSAVKTFHLCIYLFKEAPGGVVPLLATPEQYWQYFQNAVSIEGCADCKAHICSCLDIAK